jgi:hypothetical protein
MVCAQVRTASIPGDALALLATRNPLCSKSFQTMKLKSFYRASGGTERQNISFDSTQQSLKKLSEFNSRVSDICR